MSTLGDWQAAAGTLSNASRFFLACSFCADLDRVWDKGYVPTDQDLLRSRLRTTGITETAHGDWTAQIPLARRGTTADVAAAVCFLASDEASYITGQVLAVNGGMYM